MLRHTLYTASIIQETQSAGTRAPSVGLLQGTSRTVITLRHRTSGASYSGYGPAQLQEQPPFLQAPLIRRRLYTISAMRRTSTYQVCHVY
jgi:hypothetical protein